MVFKKRRKGERLKRSFLFINEEIVLPEVSPHNSLARLSSVASSSCKRSRKSNYLAKMSETATPGLGQLGFIPCCPNKMAFVSNREVGKGLWRGSLGICHRSPSVPSDPQVPLLSLELPAISISGSQLLFCCRSLFHGSRINLIALSQRLA